MTAALIADKAFKPDGPLPTPEREKVGPAELFWIIGLVSKVCRQQDVCKDLP